MSRALRGWQIGRTCFELLRSATEGPLHVSLPSLVPAPVTERLWLLPWPPPARRHSCANGCSQRGYAAGTGGGSGNERPPPSEPRAGSDATSGEQPQPSQPQSGLVMGSAQSSGTAASRAGQPGEAAAGAARDLSGGGRSPDGGVPRGDMTSVVVPSEQLEHEADALLDAWEPLMAQV